MKYTAEKHTTSANIDTKGNRKRQQHEVIDMNQGGGI